MIKMAFNTKTRYGLRTMIEIAKQSQNAVVFQKDIASNQDISFKYLDQIIHKLKKAQLIKTLNGKKSGYVLTRDPKQISVYDIHVAFEPEMCVTDCVSSETHCKLAESCLAKGLWVNLNEVVSDYLKKVTLDDVMKQKFSGKKTKKHLPQLN